jgi:hypothetical protein
MGERNSYHKKIVSLSFVAFLVQVSVFFNQKMNDLIWPEKGLQIIDTHQVILDLTSIVKFSTTGVQGFSRLGTIQFFGVLILTLLCFNGIKISKGIQLDFSIKQNKGIWLLLIFLVEYTLVYFGDASPGAGLIGRYLIVPSGVATLFIAIVIGEKLAKSGTLLFLVFFLSVQLSLSVVQYNYTKNSHLLRCGNPCITWIENVQEVSNGSRSTYYFWPFNNGNPNWAISSVTPSIRFAPFQSEVMGVPTIFLPTLDSGQNS